MKLRLKLLVKYLGHTSLGFCVTILQEIDRNHVHQTSATGEMAKDKKSYSLHVHVP